MKGNILFLGRNSQRAAAKAILEGFSAQLLEFGNGLFFESRSITETRSIREALFSADIGCTILYLHNPDGSLIYSNVPNPDAASVRKILLQKSRK